MGATSHLFERVHSAKLLKSLQNLQIMQNKIVAELEIPVLQNLQNFPAGFAEFPAGLF
jgi:hypothetical protein